MTDKLYGISLLYLVAWCISPPLAYGTAYRLLALVIVGGMILLFNPRKIKFTGKQILIIGLVLYIIVITFSTGDALTQRIGILILLALALLSDCVIEENSEYRDVTWLIPFTFALCILWNICTLQELIAQPNIMRVLAKNTPLGPAYASRGVGGYGYLYTVLALLPIGIEWVCNKSNTIITRIIAVIFCATTYVMSFQSQYFMAVLISLLIPLLLFANSLKNIWARVLMIVSSLVIFAVIYANINAILEWVFSLTDGTGALARKIQDIHDIINGGTIEESEFAVRLERYIRSSKVAFTNPLTGSLTYSETGNHSTILDFFAQYGLPVGYAMTYTLFIDPFRKSMRHMNTIQVMLIIVFLLSIMNVIPFAMGAVIFIVLPIYKQHIYHIQVENS